jgi:hypothetical protein
MSAATGIFIGGPLDGEIRAMTVDMKGEPAIVQNLMLRVDNFRHHQGVNPDDEVQLIHRQYFRMRLPNDDGTWNYIYVPGPQGETS